MAKPDFYSLIKGKQDKVEDFKEALTELVDRTLQDTSLSRTQQDQLARLRARIQIDLQAF